MSDLRNARARAQKLAQLRTRQRDEGDQAVIELATELDAVENLLTAVIVGEITCEEAATLWPGPRAVGPLPSPAQPDRPESGLTPAGGGTP